MSSLPRISEYKLKKARAQAKLWYKKHRNHVLKTRKTVPSKIRRAVNMRSLRLRWKYALFTLLGNRCIGCDFSDSRALRIDHIKGKGYLDKRGRGLNFYRILVLSETARKEVQLLCANCNWIKRHENKEYPMAFR